MQRQPHSRSRDRLILAMLSREAINAIRAARPGDLAWIALGGGGISAYGFAVLVQALRAHTVFIQSRPGLIAVAVSSISLLLGVAVGIAATRLAMRRAFAPWTGALPLSPRDRRRMAVWSAGTLGIVGLMLWAGIALLITALVEPSLSGPALVLAAAPFLMGLLVGMLADRRVAGPVVGSQPADHRWTARLGCLDRWAPAWLGSWAWRLPGGRIVPGLSLGLKVMTFGLIAVVAILGSANRHYVEPAATVGTVGGLAVFMLSLKLRPLASPVLRSGPVGFTQIWLRLASLPLAVSFGYFALLSGSAVAADPAAWAAPIRGGVEWLFLGLLYACFAAYFATRPGLAVLAFLAAIGETAYESVEYGRPIYAIPVILAVWLWLRGRRRYRHG